METLRFALTKIQPPRPRPGLVPRPALERRLGEALLGPRLVLLCAPAGFGKTAALTRQLAQLGSGVACAWIGCDEDDDLHRVLDCLCAALEPWDLPWRVAPDALAGDVDGGAQAGRAGLRRSADALVNALAGAERRGVIVLEDTHRIADPAVFEWCDLLLERLPAGWTLVMSSRIDPPLALPRLRASGELVEFRIEDLRFSPEEAGALAGQVGVREAAQVEPLWRRTQGWAAGLRLALNAGSQGGAGARGAADRHAFDYLASEVLDALPTRLRHFLLRASLLPELSAARCAAVTGHDDAARLLDETERRGLFVSVLAGEAGEGPTLALHDLFRDCLEERLARELPDEVPGLLQRAADTEPDAQRRIGFLLRGGHWVQAQAVLEAAAPAWIGAGALDTVFRVIEQFPPARRQQAPALDLLDGIANWARWSFPRMAESLQRALAGYRQAGGGDSDDAKRCLVYHAVALCGQGLLAQSRREIDALMEQPMPDDVRAPAQLVRTWHALDGDTLAPVPALYAEAVDTLERADDPDLWTRCQTLPIYVGLPGMAPVLQRYNRGAGRHVGDAPTTRRAAVFALDALSLLWQGRVDEAAAALQSAEEDQRWLGTPLSVATFTRSARALWHAWRGEGAAALAAAQGLLDDLDDPRSRDRRRVWRGYCQFFLARIALAVGDVAALRTMHDRLPARPDAFEPALLAAQRCALAAHVAWAEGRFADAVPGYRAALEREAQLVLFAQNVEIRLRLAHACQALGDVAGALDALQPLPESVPRDQAAAALMVGERVLADLTGGALGARMAPALKHWLMHWQRVSFDLRGQAQHPPVLAAPIKVAGTIATPVGTGLPLTEREREVLERIAAGDSNKLIARAFDLSPHTVKRHVANILDKLGANSRGQAAACYRANL